MTSSRESTELMRAAILSILWERGDNVGNLVFSDLHFRSDMIPFFAGSIDWLQGAGLIRVANITRPVDGPPLLSRVSLTSKGEDVLSKIPPTYGHSFGTLLTEALKESAKDGIKSTIKDIGPILWATIVAYSTSP